MSPTDGAPPPPPPSPAAHVWVDRTRLEDIESRLSQFDRRLEEEARIASKAAGDLVYRFGRLAGAEGFGGVAGKVDRLLDESRQQRREASALAGEANGKVDQLGSTVMSLRLEQSELLAAVAKRDEEDRQFRKGLKVSLERQASQLSEILKMLRNQ